MSRIKNNKITCPAKRYKHYSRYHFRTYRYLKSTDSISEVLINEDYTKKIVREQKMFTHQDGLVDTIRFLLEDFADANRILLKGLVSQNF